MRKTLIPLIAALGILAGCSGSGSSTGSASSKILQAPAFGANKGNIESIIESEYSPLAGTDDQTDQLQFKATYKYDAAGNLTSLIQEAYITTDAGIVIYEEQNTYDGNQLKKTVQKSYGNPDTITGKLTKTGSNYTEWSFEGTGYEKVKETYEGHKRTTTDRNDKVIASFNYNDMNLATEQKHFVGDEVDYHVLMEYDGNGQVTSYTELTNTLNNETYLYSDPDATGNWTTKKTFNYEGNLSSITKREIRYR